jgi:hypothetical protein
MLNDTFKPAKCTIWEIRIPILVSNGFF